MPPEPTIAAWESALATRDSVYFQLGILTCLVVLGLGFFRTLKSVVKVLVSVGFVLALAVLAFSVWNVYAWTL